MPFDVPSAGLAELSAALLQWTVTVGLGLLCLGLWVRFRKPYFRWWAVAWALYALRLLAIGSFLVGGDRLWLYWHQVVTGWTALALLWAAIVFSRRPGWRWSYTVLALFPAAWSYVAIYRLDHFLWAALPAVLFLSAATLWTALVFWRHHRQFGSGASAWLAAAFGLWALHHLDYPILRAQGAWTPWGYYLDIVFELGVGLGILLLVGEDLRRGLQTLSEISGDLQSASTGGDILGALVERPLTLPTVRGAALYLTGATPGYRTGAGVCADWPTHLRHGPIEEAIERVVRGQSPEQLRVEGAPGGFASVIPVTDGHARSQGALVIISGARDPFTALDDQFLEALGQQMGAALESAELHRSLRERTEELERLSAQTVRRFEDERKRLARELHDETAQVFAALSLELGSLKESTDPRTGQRVDAALKLVGEAITGIRSVAGQLRPPLLDDLGVLPALTALMDDFEHQAGLRIERHLVERLPHMDAEAELALYRSLQEALSNVARHTSAGWATVTLEVDPDRVTLVVLDGGGVPERTDPEVGGTGLAGLRERLAAVGGILRFEASPHGSTLRVVIPRPAAGHP